MIASMFSDRTVNRLRDILEDARRIESFVEGMSLSDFVASERTIFATERLLQRITEAAIQIEPEDAARLGPKFPLAQMRALGNRLRHEYRYIDHAVVFDLARIDVPALASEVEILLQSEDD